MRLGRKKATQRLNGCCAFEVEGSAAVDAVLLSWKASVAENQGREGQGVLLHGFGTWRVKIKLFQRLGLKVGLT